jgi:GNAT superfamily N-acetyltransferase
MRQPTFVRADIPTVNVLLGFIARYYAFDGIAFDAARIRRGLLELIAAPTLGSAWLIRVGDEFVGHFILSFGFDLEFGGRQATLTDLFLDENVRRQGLGQATFAFIEQTLGTLGILALELQVERDNLEAQQFYRQVGMRPHDRIPMSKSLPTADLSPPPLLPTRAEAHQPSLSLRPVAADDTSELVALAVSTGLFSPDEADTLLRATLDALHAGQLPAGHQAQVCIDSDGTKVGWAYFSPDANAAAVWELWWIGVAPAAQRQGGGAILLDFVESQVRTASGRLLLIATSSLPALGPARRFYAKRGYSECGRIPNFYAAGDDKVILAKQLAAQP